MMIVRKVDWMVGYVRYVRWMCFEHLFVIFSSMHNSHKWYSRRSQYAEGEKREKDWKRENATERNAMQQTDRPDRMFSITRVLMCVCVLSVVNENGQCMLSCCGSVVLPSTVHAIAAHTTIFVQCTTHSNVCIIADGHKKLRSGRVKSNRSKLFHAAAAQNTTKGKNNKIIRFLPSHFLRCAVVI